ncbi:hypothetical protein BUALT_Bualt11G0028200 [Buddleja alternifolia]|uniref:Uncharacterized protein n=1 Tax=Buddleja alternifolia TaxID=168488 RepID=A0AAV6WSD0_9LAMI|nr:hypothetical protein BUALT_Bualt11G0028200 [Buddleja alternifolia]
MDKNHRDIYLLNDNWLHMYCRVSGNDEVQAEFVNKWIQAHINDSKVDSDCARIGGPCGGAIFWQVMAQGMENWSDGYEVVLEQSPSTTNIINPQSRRISSLNNNYHN